MGDPAFDQVLFLPFQTIHGSTLTYTLSTPFSWLRARYIRTLPSLLYLPFPFLSNAARHLSAVLVFFLGFPQNRVLYPPFHPFSHPGKTKNGGCFFLLSASRWKKKGTWCFWHARAFFSCNSSNAYFFGLEVVYLCFFSPLLGERRGLCACRARVLGFFFPCPCGECRGSCIYLDWVAESAGERWRRDWDGRKRGRVILASPVDGLGLCVFVCVVGRVWGRAQ